MGAKETLAPQAAADAKSDAPERPSIANRAAMPYHPIGNVIGFADWREDRAERAAWAEEPTS
ncbi:hypothetical protein D1O30_16985 [Methylocystis hirsuta]|uniref:Uncharacterized protein n=1 Tax=Methylocystis hirsuta TaxID=369798 RepID=A0A3M9XS16_9HYPH|nr:hypothetical protein D1O30_16985 [Methylocystis hirsuta]